MTQAIGPTTPYRLTSYLSLDMLKYHRRRGVRYEDLAPQGSPADQDAAVAALIETASARADSILLQTLAATLDTVLDTVNINRRGRAVIHPRYRPIVGVTSIAIGAAPDMLRTLASLSGVGVETDSFSVPVGPAIPFNTSQGPLQFSGVGAPMDQAWIQYTYCNGFPVTVLTAAATQGATSLSVADTTGIIQGKTWMTIYAGRNRFRFLAGAVSTAPQAGYIGTGAGTVGCAALPFAVPNNSLYPTMVSAMPSDAIEAVTLLCRGLTKQSSTGNTSGATSTGNRRQSDPLAAGDDFALAEELLSSYRVPLE